MTETKSLRVVSASEVSEFNGCEYRWWMKYVLRRQKKNSSDAIKLGTIGHDIIKSFYKLQLEGADYKTAIFASAQKIDDVEDLAMRVHLTRVLLPYLNTYKNAPWKVLAVEQTYKFPISDSEFDVEYIFGLQIDLLIEWTDGPHKGQIAIVDWKFTQNFWNEFQFRTYVQLPKYRFVLNKLGIPATRGVLAQIRTRGKENLFKHDDVPPRPEFEKNAMREHSKAVARMFALRELGDPNEIGRVVRRALNFENCVYCRFQMPCESGMVGNVRDQMLRLETDYETDTYGYNND